MDFKVGDSVIFLDEKGGGVITEIKNKNTVVVSDDSGFPISYPVNKLVKINSSAITESESSINVVDGNNAISLFYVPTEEGIEFSANWQLILVNNTRHDFYFELFYKQGGQAHKFNQGQIEKHNKKLVITFSSSEIEKYSQLYFQCLFSSSREFTPVHPLFKVVQFKASKLFKESSFIFSPEIQKIAFSVCLLEKAEYEKLLNPTPHLFHNEIMKEEVSEAIKISKPHHINRVEKVVDLHIHELIDDLSNVSESQMLNIQLNAFDKEMNQAIINHYASITFIHGVGTGVLKHAILERLKSYEGIKHMPASFKKYGHGAIKIEF